MAEECTRIIYYGDNLDILRALIQTESVDLVYLDPPFKSQQEYNLLFRTAKGEPASAQVRAFTDTWKWDQAARATYDQLMNDPLVPGKVSQMVQAFHQFLGPSEMLAYLVMMTTRLLELHRVLKPTGSLYLHCDPAASHYLKLVLDTIFGPANFRNEIVWKRTTSHGDTKQGAKHFGRLHDTILLYSKTSSSTWNPQFVPFGDDQIAQQYNKIDKDGRRYRLVTPTAKKPGGDTSYEFHGVRPPKGRYWAYTKEKLEAMVQNGLIYFSSTGQPYIKYYLDERPGVGVQSI